MKHTPTYNLTQWELTDRIQMDDFNANNLKLEAALNQKLEPVLLLDKTEDLTNQTYWNIDLPFTPGDWFALFIEISWPKNIGYLNPGTSSSNSTDCQIGATKFAVACFPLRNPDAFVYFLPLYGITQSNTSTTHTYQRMQSINIRHYNSGVNIPNGTYHIRIFGFK